MDSSNRAIELKADYAQDYSNRGNVGWLEEELYQQAIDRRYWACLDVADFGNEMGGERRMIRPQVLFALLNYYRTFILSIETQ